MLELFGTEVRIQIGLFQCSECPEDMYQNAINAHELNAMGSLLPALQDVKQSKLMIYISDNVYSPIVSVSG